MLDMSSRFVINLRKLQSMGGASQHLHFRIPNKSYATRMLRSSAPFRYAVQTQQNLTLLNISLPALRMIANNSTANVAQRKKPQSFDVLLEKLETHYEANRYLNSDIFESILEQLEAEPDAYNQLLSTTQVHLLLGGCGTLTPSLRPEQRLQLFQRLWKYLERNEQLTTAAHYYTHLQVLRYNRGPLIDFKVFLREILRLDPNATESQVYNELLEVACYSGNMRQASEIMAEMRAKNLALEERNFNALILGHGRNHDLNGCQTVLENMIAAGVPVSNEAQTNLAMAYIENGETEKAMSLLEKFNRQFDVGQILKMLHSALSVDASNDVILQLVSQLPMESMSGTEVPVDLRNICLEALHNGKLEAVLTVIDALPPPKFNENQDVDTYGVFLLHSLFNVEIGKERIIEICKRLKDSAKNVRALHIATEIASRRNPPMALAFFEALAMDEPLRPHYFWPLMMYNFRRHGEKGIMHTLRHMKQLQIECDLETLKEYVLPRMSIALENPEKAVKMLDEVNLKPSQTLSPIIAHILSQQKLEETYKLIELYPTKLDVSQFIVPLSKLSTNVRATRRYQQFIKVLVALTKKTDNPKVDFIGLVLINMINNHPMIRKDLDSLHRFVDGMQKSDLNISPAACDTLQLSLQPTITGVGNERGTQIIKALQKMCKKNLSLANENEGSSITTSSFIKHPRDMTMDELECHLIELEAKRMNVRGVLRRLLQVCVRDNRLERALQIKTKCDELRVQVSPGMLASIFDLYIKLKDFPNAQATLSRLHQLFPGFQIDEHKIIDYAALLVHEKRFDEAKQLLADRAAKQKIIGGDYVIKNVWNFLTNIAHLAAETPDIPTESNLTRDTFVFLTQLGYCRPHNAVLGPIVREYLLRNDICAAVEEFRRLAEQYRHTPLQFEMLSLLVRLCNATPTETERYSIDVETAQGLLSEVTKIISKVHGVVNMNSSLLLAIAESGTENQLRRLLINPEFRINQDLLIKNCEHLGVGGAVPTLLRLARASRGLHHVIDEHSVYNMLMDNFVKTNDYEAALHLFDQLESDDELKISQELLRNLVNLLRFNNVEIPSKIAIRAQVI